LGCRTLAGLRKLGIEPLAFADNNPARWNNTVDGVRVLSVPQALATYGDRATFVVTVFNGSAVRRQLKELHCPRVVHFGHLYRHYADTFLPFGGLAQPHDLAAQLGDVREAFSLWADDKSREEYVAQLQWRTALDDTRLPPPLAADETYFPADLFTLGDGETFVDCGAFDGDSIRQFLRRCRAFRAVVGLEPDPVNYRKLQDFVASLEPAARERCFLHPLAAASHSGSIRFDATATAGSAVNAAGAMVMHCVRMDELLASQPPTLIKMDIEGNELDALAGARDVIARHQPVLAVCAYHKPDDLWRIPQFIHSLCQQYQLFLRRYAEDCWELVCYAVPRARLPG